MHLFCLVALTSLHPVLSSWIDDPPPTDGVIDCNQLPEVGSITIDSEDTTIEDRVFVNCPQIRIGTNASVVFRNVTFSGYSSYRSLEGGAIAVTSASATFVNCTFYQIQTRGNGGAIFASAATLTVVDSSFRSCSSGNHGGAIMAANYSLLIIRRSYFVGNSALQYGGDIEMSQTSMACEDCNFVNSLAGGRGGAIVGTKGCQITWVNGSCVNATAAGGTTTYGGCIGLQEMGNTLDMQNVLIENPKADAGGAFFLQFGAVVTLRNVTVINALANIQGACIYMYSDCSTTVVDSHFDRCHAATGNGGFAYIQSNSSLLVLRTRVTDSIAAQQGGAFYVQDKCQLDVLNSTITGSVASKGAHVSIQGPTSNFNCDGGTWFNDGEATGDGGGGAGTITLNPRSMARIGDCTIFNNTAFNGGGLFAGGQTEVVLTGKAKFVQNVAENSGGGLFLDGDAKLTIGGETKFWKNEAVDGCGGSFTMAGVTSKLIIASLNVSISNNTALEGSDGCILSPATATFGSSVGPIGSDMIHGNMWVQNGDTALAFRQNGVFGDFPGILERGRPAQILLTGHIFSNVTVHVQQPLPTITVVAMDVFGHLSPIDRENPVVVQLEERSGKNISFLGETVKAIVDPLTLSVAFQNIKLVAVPGEYAVDVVAIAGTVKTARPVFQYPRILVTIADCNAQELYLADRALCLPIRRTTQASRIGITCVSALMFILSLIVVGLLYKFKGDMRVKANSVNFLSIACLGASLGLLSITLSGSSDRSMCLVTPWFDHIGFTFVFSAIILKTYRIYRIFDLKKIQMDIGNRLKDKFLLRYFAFALAIMSVFLAAWDIVMPPYPEVTVVFNSFVTVDRCSLSAFSTTITFIRLFVQVVACWLAYNIRNVQAEFNESRFILFATYNWVIFGALIEVLAMEVVVDPEISFILHAIAVIVPNVLTVVLLGGIKVYKCGVQGSKPNAVENLEIRRHIRSSVTERPSGTIAVVES